MGKRYLAFLLCLVLMLSLVACGPANEETRMLRQKGSSGTVPTSSLSVAGELVCPQLLRYCRPGAV